MSKSTKKTPRSKKRPPAKRPIGRPSVWTPALMDAIVDTVATSGVSFSDAAICNGITHETLKAKQREDAEFSARLTRARASVKKGCLAHLFYLGTQKDSVPALSFLLERIWPEEFVKPTKLDHSGQIDMGAGGNASATSITAFVVNDPAGAAAYETLLGTIRRNHSENEPGRLPGGRDEG